MMIKRSVYEEDRKTLNIHAPSRKASKFLNQKLQVNGDTDTCTISVEDLIALSQ